MSPVTPANDSSPSGDETPFDVDELLPLPPKEVIATTPFAAVPRRFLRAGILHLGFGFEHREVAEHLLLSQKTSKTYSRDFIAHMRRNPGEVTRLILRFGRLLTSRWPPELSPFADERKPGGSGQDAA